MDQLLMRGTSVVGASVTDLEQGSEFDIKARAVVVAAGPWTDGLIADTSAQSGSYPSLGRALAVNAVIDRQIAPVAVGAQAAGGLKSDPIGGGSRFLFATPQDGRTLLGTWYTPAGVSSPEAAAAQGVRSLIELFNQACPGLELSSREVSGYQWGLLPLKHGYERGRPTALAERPRIVAYGDRRRSSHLLSVEGVKYTTARRVAERVVDWVFKDLGRRSPRCRTAEVRIDNLATDRSPVTNGPLAEADVRRAVNQEMAVKLSDIVLRRSNQGAGATLCRSRVAEIAGIAGAELGWSGVRQQAEIEDVMRQMANPLAVKEPVG
jgi:glycerol-3-phosphate dehydrogenase